MGSPIDLHNRGLFASRHFILIHWQSFIPQLRQTTVSFLCHMPDLISQLFHQAYLSQNGLNQGNIGLHGMFHAGAILGMIMIGQKRSVLSVVPLLFSPGRVLLRLHFGFRSNRPDGANVPDFRSGHRRLCPALLERETCGLHSHQHEMSDQVELEKSIQCWYSICHHHQTDSQDTADGEGSERQRQPMFVREHPVDIIKARDDGASELVGFVH